MFQLFNESSETDQYRDGAQWVLASSEKAICSVALMSRYLERAKLSNESPPCYKKEIKTWKDRKKKEPSFFGQLSKTKYGYKLGLEVWVFFHV